ncbi:hypothetical protein [uncultured Bifidobacterium sp.]|uniref:hypothetical protein n=1 Tax=uncultured Bifidobacterium sp. TaxID=165187 RepID=UPI002590B832|nr:hypothetical protein [uncultured Bifidobacterium sp.]
MDTTKAVMVDVQICFFLLDESPCVGLFHKDSDGYGYCDDCMVAEPNGHPILNIDEYRLAKVSVPIKSDGSYNRPEIINRLTDEMDEIIDNNEYDWAEQAKQSIALWEFTFGQTERHSW